MDLCDALTNATANDECKIFRDRSRSTGFMGRPNIFYGGACQPALVTRCLHRATLELSVKGYIVRGRTSLGVAGMTGQEEYLLRAATLSAKAQAETDHAR